MNYCGLNHGQFNSLALAELFGVQRPAITKHLGNIFETGELAEDSVCSILEHTAGDGKVYSATVQNKLHWAITGLTAAEIIYARADATKIHMGLTKWKHAPRGKILKSDVAVAKDYLSEAHVKELNRIVSAYLDLAENRAQRGIVTRMADWVMGLHFLQPINGSRRPGQAMPHLAARAASMAWVTLAASGSSAEAKRARIFPSRQMRNLPKFHFTSPGAGEVLPVSAA
jgi:hypothetical protein